ncbi:MAG: response regulator [Patescibacteria group bacterium]|nr:response regulator [Patescibacteria group bacterium]
MEKQKILFIEDDAFLARIYSKAIEDASYEAILAGTGEEGLKLAEREKPSLILLDILLPHMDGFEVLEKLKSDTALGSIPVLVITNMGGREDVERANGLGAAGYLIKAHTLPKDVVRKIQSILV